MNKTADIESVILGALADSPITLADLERSHLSWVDDRQWIGVAVYRLLGDERIRAAACDRGHMHEGDCVVEVVR